MDDITTLINFLHKKNNKSKWENLIPKYKDLITSYEKDFNINFKNRFQTHYNKVKEQIKENALIKSPNKNIFTSDEDEDKKDKPIRRQLLTTPTKSAPKKKSTPKKTSMKKSQKKK